MSQPGIPPRRVPLVVGTGVVLVAAIIAIALGVNRASTAVPPTPVPSPSAVATPAATAAPTPCAPATFGPALQPLNEPANPHVYAAVPPLSIDASKLYEATITTAKGAVVVCLEPSLAPNTVNNFVTLARNHFYDGIPFHRVCPNSADSSCGGSLSIAQAGDPNCIGSVSSSSCGGGGPGYKFNDETVHGSYVTGAVAMANSGANTNGSQFFICTGDDTSLSPNYSLFGAVAAGMYVAQQLTKGDVMETVTVSEQL